MIAPSSTPPLPASKTVSTVLGPVPLHTIGLTDAHNHVWINPPAGVAPGAPVLNDYGASLRELLLFHQAGGRALLDFQPYGCGRDARILRQLARESGVHLITCTGFHLRKYYPPESPLWELSTEAASELFIREITLGTEETLSERDPAPVQAGFIKAACEATLEASPRHLFEAAACAARQTGAMVAVHTEKGASAEQIVDFFYRQGLPPTRLMLCHIDKRPDPLLHQELARAGVLLEYDTFFRPQYHPEERLWPLLEAMGKADLCGSIALATDLADLSMWASTGKGPGLASLPSIIRARLLERGFNPAEVQAMLGENVLQRLAG